MSWDGPIDRILSREGGFVNRLDDPGGATKFGITIGTLSKWRGREVTVDEVKELTEPEARSIYIQRYIKDPGFELLNSLPLREAMLDWCVNSGQEPPIKALQRHLGVITDGALGAGTAGAANAADGDKLARLVMWDRVDFIADWMKNRTDRDRDGIPDAMENARGILKRIAELGRALS